MSFPNTYNANLKLSKNFSFFHKDRNNYAFTQFLEKKTGNKITQTEDSIEFKNSNPLFFFNYISRIELQQKNNITIRYSISLIELFKILILLIVFTAFFSKYNVQQYLEVIALFSLFFTGINIWLMNSMTRKLILQAIEYTMNGGDEDFSEEQQKWILDENRCPACGFEITIYDKNCPDCGLKLRNKVPQKPYDSSGDYQTFKYHHTK